MYINARDLVLKVCIFAIIITVIDSLAVKPKKVKKVKPKTAESKNDVHMSSAEFQQHSKATHKARKVVKFECNDSPIMNKMCDNSTSYPSDVIMKLVRRKQKMREFENFFGAVAGSYEEPRLTNRINHLADDMNLCRTRKSNIAPKWATNVNLQRRYIVQHKGRQQIVMNEQCLDQEDTPCSNDRNSFCRQQMITVKLVALDENNKMVVEKFPILGGCACFLKGNKLS